MARKREQKKDDPRILLGQLVRYYRKQRGWSQMELSFEAELDRTYIGGVERGERNIALLNICKLAKALKVRPKDLLDFRKSKLR